nr:hypothetical protein 40 [bacterium]
MGKFKAISQEEIRLVATIPCPKCPGRLRLRRSKYGLFYGCVNYPRCDASHGAHPDGTPLGIPANDETKEWRIKTHNIFDELWGRENPYLDRYTKKWRRTIAYMWLGEKMSLSEEECHIGRFDIYKCKEAICICEDKSWEKIEHWYKRRNNAKSKRSKCKGTGGRKAAFAY